MNRKGGNLGIKQLKVKYHGRNVGNLAVSNVGKIAFCYDKEWLETGFAISPFSLPLEDKIFFPENNYFEGLFGIFSDSLPDAWGRLLLDRTLKRYNLGRDITTLDKLAFVGKTGMGALEYVPDYEWLEEKESKDFDYLAKECQKVLRSQETEELDLLYKMGGSSGGARPKVLLSLGGKEWIVKFPAHVDYAEIGLQEYRYSLCAKKCGIQMTETKLYPSEVCKGYFGTVRFDREKTQTGMTKKHMATVSAILEADHNSPCLDYHTLMKLTRILTHDNKEDLENMFRRACFNVFAHNRDDHAKNFTFLYEDEKKEWRLSPAYDLTYSTTYYGEHTTSIDGNGANPGKKELLNVGIQAGMDKKKCKVIMDEIQTIVHEELGEYL